MGTKAKCSICCDIDNCQSFDISPEELTFKTKDNGDGDGDTLLLGLDKELGVVFVVRKLLSISQSTCTDLIRKEGNPSQWNLQYCSLCRKMIEEGYYVSQRIQQLFLDLEELKGRLKGKISSDNNKGIASRNELTKTKGKGRRKQGFRGVGGDEKLHRTVGEIIRDSVLSDMTTTGLIIPNQRKVSFTKMQKIRNPGTSVRRTFQRSIKRPRLIPTSSALPPVLEPEPIITEELDPMEETPAFFDMPDSPYSGNNDDETMEHEFEPEESETLPVIIKQEIVDSTEVEIKNINISKKNDDDPDFALSPDEDLVEDDDLDEDYSADRRKSPSKKKGTKKGTGKPRTGTTKRYTNRSSLRCWKRKSGQTYQCSHCSFGFKEQYLLDAHVLRKHFGENKPYKCDICDKAFSIYARLQAHKTKHHGHLSIIFPCGDDPKKPKDYEIVEPINNECTPENYSQQDLMILNFVRDGNKIYECNTDDCRQVFKSEVKRDGHKNKMHLKLPYPYVCPVESCKKAFNRIDGCVEHCHRHVLKSNYFPCSVTGCGQMYKNIIERDGHERKVHQGVEKPYKCPECSNFFRRHGYLLEHIINVHANTISGQSSADASIPTLNPIPTINSTSKLPLAFKCSKCQQRFPSRLSVEAHVRRMHRDMKPKIPCSESGCKQKFITQLALQRHFNEKHLPIDERPPKPVKQVLQKNPNANKCDFCDQTFPDAATLKQHKLIEHANLKAFMCEICSKEYSAALYLKLHQQSKHYEELGLKPFKCGECNMVLNSKRNLNHHIRLRHRKAGKLVCYFCPQSFMMPSSLEDHVRGHTLEKPFKCLYCPKIFPRNLYLINHTRWHSGVKPWKCLECQKEFSDRPTYKRHLEIHGDVVHKCPTCLKEFKVWHSFRTHLKCHENKSPGDGRRVSKTKKSVSVGFGQYHKTADDTGMRMPSLDHFPGSFHHHPYTRPEKYLMPPLKLEGPVAGSSTMDYVNLNPSSNLLTPGDMPLLPSSSSSIPNLDNMISTINNTGSGNENHLISQSQQYMSNVNSVINSWQFQFPS